MSSGVLRFRPLMHERRALLSLNLEFPDARRCQHRTTREDAQDLRRLFTRFPSILLHSVFFPSAALLFLFFYSLSSSPLCYMFSTSFLLIYLCRGSRDMSPMVTRAEVVSWPHWREKQCSVCVRWCVCVCARARVFVCVLVRA